MIHAHRLPLLGLAGTGLLATDAQAVLFDAPVPDTTLNVTFTPGVPTPSFSNFDQTPFLDLLDSDPLNEGLQFGLDVSGDLISESFLFVNSSFGATLMLGKLVSPGLGDALTVNLPTFEDIDAINLNALTPDEQHYLVFSFLNGIGEKLHGYVGFSYSVAPQQNGDEAISLSLSGFAVEDDPLATTITVPEPASLAALAGGLLLAAGRRRSA